MRQNSFSIIIFLVVSFSSAGQKVNEPRTTPEWVRPYQPFRIVGNLYYVGTYDLSCYLITTSKGYILINTGLAASEELIKENIESLGFKFSDIKILLTTQVHYDHVGAMASIKNKTGAQMMTDANDVSVLADGGNSDYELSKYGTSFAPLATDRILHDGDTIELGEMQIKILHHPGHTKGSCSYLFKVKDEQKSYRVLIANFPTIVTDRRFADITAYPSIAKDYAYTLNALRNISFDLWLASHASQFDLHDKRKPGDAYNPAAFADKRGFEKMLGEMQTQYDEKLKKDEKAN